MAEEGDPTEADHDEAFFAAVKHVEDEIKAGRARRDDDEQLARDCDEAKRWRLAREAKTKKAAKK